jgi:hypothetical protein
VRLPCNEIGFYRIEAEDLELSAREGHDPEQVEKVFASLEAEAARLVAGLLEGTLPTNDEDLFHLALFVAAQSTRGWQFRSDINQAATLRMRAEMRAQPDLLERKARSFLRARGEPAGPKEVADLVQRTYGPDGPRLVAPEPVLVQASLQAALETLTPRLLDRSPRLYVFDDPALVISDAPVGCWAPGRDRAVGMGNAALVVLPLSRHVALAYGSGDANPVRQGTAARARQINHVVADGAMRWIYEHPDDDLISKIELPPDRPKWVTERVSVTERPGERRELWQHIRR